jgi:hemerythrin superfamily protein
MSRAAGQVGSRFVFDAVVAADVVGRNVVIDGTDARWRSPAMADGFEILAEDHRAVARLFETFVHDNEDSVAREICEHLTSHTTVEEAAFYPAMRRYVDGGDDLADEAEQEHAAVKAIIARIYDSPPDGLLDLITELRRDVEQHVEREESELFPKMRDSGVDAERLGAEIEAVRAASAKG